MTRVIDRQRVISLRRQGKTYSEIKHELNISKSTLSNWLSKYPLTSEQVINLAQSKKRNKFLGIEKIRLTKQKK
jgi:transposase